jgi:hypothetical protein
MEFGLFHEFQDTSEAEAFSQSFALVDAAEQWGLDAFGGFCVWLDARNTDARCCPRVGLLSKRRDSPYRRGLRLVQAEEPVAPGDGAADGVLSMTTILARLLAQWAPG